VIPEILTPQTRIVRGDQKSFSIAAASSLATTDRDARMRDLDQPDPGYRFARHKGYPVPGHIAALAALGPCPIHRRSFAPVKAVLAREELRR
jgi:ribonuclease HII